jgi:hypothetical protein
VWFVERTDYDEAISDGDLTIGELEGLDPLKGTASEFNEVLRPSEVENIAMLIVRLKGHLEDGRPFSANHVHVHMGHEPSTTNITIG